MTAPDRYGVMGYPVAHSRSPVIHRLFALQTEQDMQYDLIQVEPGGLDSAVRQFQRAGGKGLNITTPHKGDAALMADELSDRARVAGAVNTLLIKDDELFGDNTDGAGLVQDLTQNEELELQGANILILGAGGATRGILGPLCAEKPTQIIIANRTLPKAEALVMHFSGEVPVKSCRFQNVPRDVEFDLIVNATSASLQGETPPYPKTAVSDKTVCYDLSYGLAPTPFSSWAARHGAARSLMGWGMLVEQAAESFELWRGVRPDTESVLGQLNLSAS
ncbi:MAG: shikimate dehydrogenase [Woeseia sp.]|nr:shikimate dehydrogenase [Woeseia sp.]MBT8097913.1 shikimate dehydrogenase [Woeseia sp.]NNE60753.1 shikimate dehydrogenase [Woeseia sp.]NNL55399.1 shikimate dehydrogenase [Woeseia sp.]